MEEELYKKGDFCDAQLLTTHTLSAKGPTLNCDLSICFYVDTILFSNRQFDSFFDTTHTGIGVTRAQA